MFGSPFRDGHNLNGMMGKVLMFYVPDLLRYTDQPILLAKEKLGCECSLDQIC